MITEYFNIHNIAKIRIRKNVGGLFARLNPELEYFRVDTLDRPDIDIRVGRFEPDMSDTDAVGCYRVKKDYIYLELDGSPVDLYGLDGRTIHMNINPKLRGIRKLWPALGGQNILLRPLLQIVGLKKKFILLHGSGVGKDGICVVFAGRPGVFKTSLAIDYITKGYDFYGDENVIIKDNRVLSYPFNISSFQYKQGIGKEYLSKYEKVKLLGHIISKRKEAIKIGNEGKNINLFYVQKARNQKEISITSIDKEHMLEMLYSNEYEEIDIAPTHTFSGIKYYGFRELLEAYTSINTNSRLTMFWGFIRNELRDLVEHSNIYLINMPKHYSHYYTDVITQYITGDEHNE